MERVKKCRWIIAATGAALVAIGISLVGCSRSGSTSQPVSPTPKAGLPLGPETESFFDTVIERMQRLPPSEVPMMESPVRACDLDSDGDCDEADRQIFDNAFGKCRNEPGYNPAADFDRDGCVDLDDQPVVDITAPSCTLTGSGTNAEGREYVEFTVQDEESGLIPINVLQATNVTVDISSFPWGATAPVVVTATRIDNSQGTRVELEAVDAAGNVTTCESMFNQPPTTEAGPDQMVYEGDIVSLASATFTDPDVEDTHAATIDWGDGTVEPGTVSESDGSGTVSGSHIYAEVVSLLIVE